MVWKNLEYAQMESCNLPNSITEMQNSQAHVSKKIKYADEYLYFPYFAISERGESKGLNCSLAKSHCQASKHN